jgi:hypothetical protein
MKHEYSRQNVEKYPNTKFHENSSSGIGVVPYGRADGRTDGHITKQIIEFRNFATAAKNAVSYFL